MSFQKYIWSSKNCILFSSISHRPDEAPSDDNTSSSNTDSAPFDPHENYDDQLYEADNLSDAEVGQKLIDFLLRTGEIKTISTNPPIQNAALAQRCQQINNDRYDELIAAFNVILEEIILQGNSKASSKDLVLESQISSNNPNGQDSDVIEHSYNTDQIENCTKNGPCTDPMNRCLTRFEKELLQKIKTLTNLLNGAMKKRSNNEELNDNLYESQRDRRQIQSNK